MNRVTSLLAALLCLSACGSNSTGPASSQVPKLGVYSYGMTFCDPFESSCLPLTYDGEMTITYATADSIAGSFDVPAMGAAIDLGFWNVDAYVVYSHINSGSRIGAHRLTRSASGLTCEGGVLDPGDLSNIPFSRCVITFEHSLPAN